MHRIVPILIGVLLLAPSSAQAGAYVHHGQRPCTGWQYDLTNPATRSTRGPRLVTCVFTRLGLASQAPTAVAVADRESGFLATAFNPSGAAGLFQHMLAYWAGRRAAYLPAWLFPRPWLVSWANPLANSWVAARMVKAGGWGPWQ